MEQKFYRDEFEQMLRDTTDEFRMHPQRKVWHSIYNNFHPDRKWPSLAVSLILLTAILYVGVTNNNSINKTRTTLSDSIAIKSLLAQNELIYQPAEVAIRRNQNTIIPYPNISVITQRTFNNTTPQDPMIDLVLDAVGNPTLAKKDMVINNGPSEGRILNLESEYKEATIAANSSNTNSLTLREAASKKNINKGVNNTDLAADLNSTERLVSDVSESDIAIANTTSIKEAKAKQQLKVTQIEERAWIEDYAFHNKKNHSKWKNKLSMQFYITPSIGYRTRYKNNDFEPSFGLLQRQSQTTPDPEVVAQQAAMNIEAGASLIKDLTKKIRVRTGIQFNYSNYITYAHKLQHPGQTTVLLNDINTGALMPVSYSSSYGNVLGENKTQLNNSSVQLSIPIGVDYKLMGNDKIKWYAGASLQPGFILNGNSYLVSSDYKHFAEDKSLLRSFNVNSAIETFVSIKAPSGTMINLGPQFRYQLMSTHSKQYSYTEKLYNIGLKIGITKQL